MKRTITLLLVLLVSLPVLGQRIQIERQKHESFKINKTIKKRKDAKKHRHFLFKNKRAKLVKSSKADKNSLDSLTSHEWDQNLSQWKPMRKEQFTYDANENIHTEIISIWNNSKWTPLEKYEFIIDMGGNLISITSYYQVVLNQWELYNKFEYIYDGNGNLTSGTSFYWNSMTSQWDNAYKIEYTYDGNHNMWLETGYEWFPSVNQWLNSYKDELFYTNNLLTSEINSYWNYGTSQWDLYSKWDYAYDGSNNLISEISNEWDLGLNDWINQSKYEYQYDMGFHIIGETDSLWNINTNQWDLVYQYEYTYDSNSNPSTEIKYEWIGNPGEWVEDKKDEYIYDLAYDIADLIVPFFYETYSSYFNINFNNMVIAYRGYEFEDPNWVDTDKMILYYSDYNNALSIDDEILANTVKIYPNPVDNILTIDSEMVPLKKVEVFSILGNKVKEINTGFNAIPFNNLSSGTYIMRILSEKGSTTRKLIKK